MIDRLLLICSIALTSLSFVITSDVFSDGCAMASQACIFILFIKALFKISVRRFKLPKPIYIWVTMTLISLLLYVLYPYDSMIILSDIRQIFLPLAITFCSYVLFNITHEDFERVLIFLCIFTAICAIYAIISSGGFTIMTLYREGVVKNQTAPYFVQFSIIAFLIALKNKSRALTILMFFVALMLLAYPVVLRARTATLGALVIVLFAFIKKYRVHIIYILPILCVIAISYFGDEIKQLFESSIIGNANISDIDGISSGRLSRNEESFSDWMDYFFFGSLSTFNHISSNITKNAYLIPHFYLLWTLVKYGLIGSVPFFVIYFYNLVTAIKISRTNYETNQYMLLCMLLAYIVSLAEYSAPFGPGSSFIITYILYGKSIKYCDSTNHSCKSIKKRNILTE